MFGDKQNFRSDTITFRPEVGKMLLFPSSIWKPRDLDFLVKYFISYALIDLWTSFELILHYTLYINV